MNLPDIFNNIQRRWVYRCYRIYINGTCYGYISEEVIANVESTEEMSNANIPFTYLIQVKEDGSHTIAKVDVRTYEPIKDDDEPS